LPRHSFGDASLSQLCEEMKRLVTANPYPRREISQTTGSCDTAMRRWPRIARAAFAMNVRACPTLRTRTPAARQPPKPPNATLVMMRPAHSGPKPSCARRVGMNAKARPEPIAISPMERMMFATAKGGLAGGAYVCSGKS